MTKVQISGNCAEKYEGVIDAFHRNFVEEQEIGASFCVFEAGKKVVDIWGGHTDRDRTKHWKSDTLVNVWSTTKGIMALCVARLVGQGKLQLERSVADYWPGFAENGKETITVSQLFSHQAGLCGPSRQLTESELLDTDFVANLLAAEAPHWPVGTRSGYHALTIGPLADGLFKHITGKTVGRYFRTEIGNPANIDFHIGLDVSQDIRVAEIVHDGLPQSGGPDKFNEYQRMAQINVPVYPEIANKRAWRAQGTPSAGGHGNARSIAEVYSALATDRQINGIELVTKEALEAVTSIQIDNEDLVLRFPVTWGVGFALNERMGAYGPNPRSFGHHGWGGSFGFADPDNHLGVAYAMNFMREPQDGMDPRFAALVSAVYDARA